MRNLFIMLAVCFALFSFESIAGDYLPDINQEIAQVDQDINDKACPQQITAENPISFNVEYCKLQTDSTAKMESIEFELINSDNLPLEVGWRFS